jgi:excisionase family DNA binding protein
MGKRFEDLPLFMTPAQLAECTGEHVNSIRRGIAEGRIPADKVNGRWRICRDAVFANTRMAASGARRDDR